MTLGRTSDNKIKIKTDGGTTRAVECACCGGCDLPPVCLDGYPNNGWYGGVSGDCYTYFENIAGCMPDAPIITNAPWVLGLCGGAKWVLLIGASGGNCLGNVATNFYCKSDGIDSPIGTYSGYNYGGDGYLTFTVESC